MTEDIPKDYQQFLDWDEVDFDNVRNKPGSGIWHPTVKFSNDHITLKVPVCRPREWSNKDMLYQWQVDDHMEICTLCLERLLSVRTGDGGD